MRCVSRIGSDLPNEAVHFQSPERAALNGKCTEASPRPGPKAERSDFGQYKRCRAMELWEKGAIHL
jgi:hypothetical protein